jgi:hypothetical protein
MPSARHGSPAVRDVSAMKWAYNIFKMGALRSAGLKRLSSTHTVDDALGGSVTYGFTYSSKGGAEVFC